MTYDDAAKNAEHAAKMLDEGIAKKEQEIIEEYLSREEVKARNAMFQQLEEEQGIVYTDGHFHKTRRGILGMDDHIQSGVNAKLLDIRDHTNQLTPDFEMEMHDGNRLKMFSKETVLAIFDKYLSYDEERS